MKSFLEEFTGYFEAKEPGRRERADAWATAIGLQKVDGLNTSSYLIETAKAHIEGEITQEEAHSRIRDYYLAKSETEKPDPTLEEPDKVAERMAAIINDAGFEFTPEYYISLHKRLFEGVFSSAGKLRTVNILKREWVLKDDSVTYGDKATIKDSLVRDFVDEREFEYETKDVVTVISHFSRFIAQIWQVHPFMEGNTRTTALFAIKYLKSLGFAVSNNEFRENSWYFRNALVRANYADYRKNAKRDWSYLEKFFRNLILGEHNELKSRYLLIGYKADPINDPINDPIKTQYEARVFEIICENPGIKREAIADRINRSVETAKRTISKLIADGKIEYRGSNKTGGYFVK